MKKVTIKDISRITGFSPMTVSRVINNEKYVKRETRQMVINAIKKYGYEPNYFARSLKTNKSKTIGLIIGEIENPWYSRFAKGVIDTAESHDYSVMVCNSKYSPDLGEKYLQMLIERGVDGLIIATIDLSVKLIHRVSKKHIPFVLVTRKLDVPENINYIVADDYYGGRLAAEYLANLGHKEIFFLRTANVYGANERVRAFRDVMLEHGIDFDESNISKILNNAEESYEETKRLLSGDWNYTAIVAANDFLALGAMEAIFESGLEIPKDISLVGYDNLTFTSVLKTPLTTVDQPNFLFGEISAVRVMQMIKEPETRKTPEKLVFRPVLIVRDSCRNL